MFKKILMPMLEEEGAGGTGGVDTGDGAGKETKPKTFDEILAENKDYQAEFDRRVSKGIKTAIENERSRIDEIVDERLSEADRLAKMTEIEKQKYEQEKQAKEIAKREADITRRELQAEAKNTLAEKKLPQALADILNYADAEACKSSIATVEEAFNNAVKSGVEERLKGGKPPQDATHNDDKGMDELEKQIHDAMARPNRIF